MPTVLIVDDEPDNIELLGRRLTRRGFAVISATSAEEGIAKARKLRTRSVSTIDKEILANYERIRKRLGGTAFVPAHRERCTACKMMIPHILYTRLLKGKEIQPCESCGRLLYWSGHFPEDHDKYENAKPKPAEDVIPGVPEF